MADRFLFNIDSSGKIINGYKYNGGFKDFQNFHDGGFICSDVGQDILVLKLDSMLFNCSRKHAVFNDSLISNVSILNCYLQENNSNFNLKLKSGFYEVNNNLTDSFYCLTLTGLVEPPTITLSYLFKVVPNPMTNSFQIFAEVSENSVINISLYNLYGQCVLKKQILIMNGISDKIDTKNLSKGLYFIFFKDENGNSASAKMVVE